MIQYRFKSSDSFHTLPIDGNSTTVGNFKDLIWRSKLYGRGRDYDLIITDAITGEGYNDDSGFIRKDSRVVIRRIPGVPCKPIVVENAADARAGVKERCNKIQPPDSAVPNEVEELPSTDTSPLVWDLPSELCCPLCKGVMKVAAFTKCCFDSFCYECIKDYMISNSACVCGAKNVDVDGLLPNPTVRNTINRILGSKSSDSSAEDAGSASQVQDASSAATNGGRQLPVIDCKETASVAREKMGKGTAVSTSLQNSKKREGSGIADLSEAECGDTTVQESASQKSHLQTGEKVHQEVKKAHKKKKVKKTHQHSDSVIPSGVRVHDHQYKCGMQPEQSFTPAYGYGGSLPCVGGPGSNFCAPSIMMHYAMYR